MNTKSLLIGIISFIAGALVVSTAASLGGSGASHDSMDAMVQSLEGKNGDAFDKEFLSQMIVHHEGAIEMAKLARAQAKHDEVKKLSEEIISAQEHEIGEMRQWQQQWGYAHEESRGH